ncbi:MAG: peptidase MA family metallohydrolase [Candidatus Omnitrophota bacterium]
MKLNPRFIVLTLGLFILWGSYSYAAEWKELRGKHVVVYYNNAPKDFVDAVEEATETYYNNISKNLGFGRTQNWSYENRVKIYIYDSSEDYVYAGKQAGWSHGSASPTQKKIRTFPTAHGFFDSTLPHELGHIVFRDFVGYKTNIPLWFEEGVAMYAERAKRFGSHDVVRQAMHNGRFMPLDELTMIGLTPVTDEAVISLFYAESASVVKYLIDEHGKAKFVRFCRKLKEGSPFNWALDSVYVRFKDINKLNDSWERYLNNE